MIAWPGQSGTNYYYEIRPSTQTPPAGGGNYIFVRHQSNVYHALYIGETENFIQRFQNHEKATCARQNQMNEIHYHVHNGNVHARRAEEQDLILRWNPTCNG